MLFEGRLGWEVYRPGGQEWFDKGYYSHPIEAEGRANLTQPGYHGKFPPDNYLSQTNSIFRWMSLEEVQDLDLIVCSIDRVEEGFHKLKNDLGLKCKIARYTGNPYENFDFGRFDFMLCANLRYFHEHVESGRKPGMLFFPEFEEALHKYTEPLVKEENDIGCPYPIMRTFINFIYHHPEHANHQNWKRYAGYLERISGTPIMHGLGTPPPGMETGLDIILDKEFDRMGKPELKDRSTWPTRFTSRGEPKDEIEVAELIKASHILFNQKNYDGYGFVPFKAFSIGRPIICEHGDYNNLTAGKIIEHMKTGIHISGDDGQDFNNIQEFLRPEKILEACKEVRKRFDEVVSFENQAQELVKFV